VNKSNEFKAFMDIHCPDLVAITESWLDKDILSSMFVDLHIYWCFRKDRLSRGGGVCLLIRRSLNLILSQVDLPTDFDNLEVLAVDVCNKSGVLPLRLVVVYRPPDFPSVKNDSLVLALDWLGNGCARMCIMGDFNLPSFNRDLFVYPNSHVYNSFCMFTWLNPNC